jgi:hypothetical protein
VAAFKLFEFPKTLAPFFGFDGERIVWGMDSMAQNWRLLTEAPDISRDFEDATLAFCMAFTTSKLLRRRDWQIYSSWRLRRLKMKLISDGLIAQLGLDFFQHSLAFFAAGRRLGLEMIAIEAPPVRTDELAILNGAPADNILDIDRVVRMAVRKRLREMGVIVLSPPEETMDARRFLRPEFCKVKENDFHHANADYGLKVVRQLYDAVDALHPDLPRVGAPAALQPA